MKKLVISILRYITGIAIGSGISASLYYLHTGKMLSPFVFTALITSLLIFGCCVHIYVYYHNYHRNLRNPLIN